MATRMCQTTFACMSMSVVSGPVSLTGGKFGPEASIPAVAVCLAELVARRDVGHPIGEAEVAEPRRLADVEMIVRVQVVIEAGQRRLGGVEAAAVGEAAVDQQDVEPGLGEVTAEHEAMLASADDDAVIRPIECLRHHVPSVRPVPVI